MAVPLPQPNHHQENAAPKRKAGGGLGKDPGAQFLEAQMKNGNQATGSNQQSGQGSQKSPPQSKASVGELEGLLKRLGQEKTQAQSLDSAFERAGVSEGMKFCSRHRIEAFENLEAMLRGDIRVKKMGSGDSNHGPPNRGHSHSSPQKGSGPADKTNSVLQVRPGNGQNGPAQGQRQGAPGSHPSANNGGRSPPKVGQFGTSSPMH